MRLQNENIYDKYKILGGSLFLAFLLLNASFKEESSIEDVTLSSENKVVSEEVFNNIMLNSNEIDSYVSEYNLDNRLVPASVFKVLEYVDSNMFYKVRIVNVYVDFDINNNPVYTFNDAFSDEYLFSSYSCKDNIVEYTSLTDDFINATNIKVSDLKRLEAIAYIHNFASDYVDGTIEDNYENMSMSEEMVLKKYIKLIPEGVRVKE